MSALVRHVAVAVVALSLSAQAFAAPRADAAQPSVAPAPAAPAPTTPAPAAPPASPAQTYTFAQAVAATLAHNPQIAAAQQTLEAAQQNVLAARAGYGPTLSVNGNGSLGTFGATTSSGVTGAPASSVTGTGTATVAASLPIFDGGKTRVAVESAEAQATSAQAALRQTEQDLALQAGTQFFAVLKDEGLVNVQQQVLTQDQAQLAMTQAQVRAGVAPQSDVLQAQAQVAQAEVALLQAQANVLTAKASLAGTMGVETTASIEAESPQAPAPRVAVTSAQVIAAALTNRPEIAKANAGVQTSRAALDTAYVDAGPQIGINVGAGYTPLSTSRDLNNTTSYGLTGTISLPLFDSGKGKAEIASAQAGLKSARAQLDAARQTVSQDAYQSYLNAVQASANVTATEAARAAADQALSVAQGRYRAGVGTIIEVITAETTAAQADVNATSAVYDYQSALITLEHAQGAPIVAGAGGGTQ